MGLDEAQEVYPRELRVNHKVHQLRLAVLGHRAVLRQEGDLGIVACADGNVSHQLTGFHDTHILWWGSKRISCTLQPPPTI